MGIFSRMNSRTHLSRASQRHLHECSLINMLIILPCRVCTISKAGLLRPDVARLKHPQEGGGCTCWKKHRWSESLSWQPLSSCPQLLSNGGEGGGWGLRGFARENKQLTAVIGHACVSRIHLVCCHFSVRSTQQRAIHAKMQLPAPFFSVHVACVAAFIFSTPRCVQLSFPNRILQ